MSAYIHKRVEGIDTSTVAMLDKKLRSYKEIFDLYRRVATERYGAAIAGMACINAPPELLADQEIDVELTPHDIQIHDEISRLDGLKRDTLPVKVGVGGVMINPKDFAYNTYWW